MDVTAPKAMDLDATNRTGGTAGVLEPGDSVTLSYSEAIAAGSVISVWAGDPLQGTLHVDDGGNENDLLSVYSTGANPARIDSLGTIRLASDTYVTGTSGPVIFPATLVLSSDKKSVIVTISGLPIKGTIGAGTVKGDMTWTAGSASSRPTDLAGNPQASGEVITEKGKDLDF